MSVHSENGITCKIESSAGARGFSARLFDGMRALLLYTALWGGLCGMASLSAAGIVPLALGGIFASALALTPRRRRLWAGVFAAGMAGAVLLLLVRRQEALDGVKLILTRFFAASEARQAYTYERFSILAGEEAWVSCMRYALAPLGIVTGLACGAGVRRPSKLPLAGIFLLFSGLIAYLGVSPATGWTALLALALILALVDLPVEGAGFSRLLACGGSVLMLALICAVVLAVLPGEDARLSAWDERARDALALQTAAYRDPWQAQPPPEPEQTGAEKQFYREEETPGGPDGGEAEWRKPLSVVLVILLFALLLFLPALFSDLLKKRRARSRAELDAPDHSAAIRAMFLYALRWLRLGGLAPANIPFSGYAGQIGALFSEEVRAGFEAVLPLWQEAAYSTHAMDEAQRLRMLRFMETVRQSVWDGLGGKERILAKYVYAL